jgi:hypothetical protein
MRARNMPEMQDPRHQIQCVVQRIVQMWGRSLDKESKSILASLWKYNLRLLRYFHNASSGKLDRKAK